MDSQSWAKGESWPSGRGQETVKFKQKNVFLISPVGGITHPVLLFLCRQHVVPRQPSLCFSFRNESVTRCHVS